MAGSGTSSDPFLVQTTADLKKVGSGTDGWGMGSSGSWIYYKQTADIDWNDDADTYFEPIGHQSGSSHSDFYGVYDGNGYKIKNMQINKPSDDYIGLFAWFAEGELKNVGLEGGNITGHNRTGSLVGLCDYNVVNNCFSSANVTGNDYTGGLIGYNYADTENCYTTGDVEGANYIGGLMGRAINCDVTKCYASGNVTANNYGAGLVGSLGSSNTTLTKSYALNTSISTSSGNTIFARVFATGSGANDNYGHEDMTVLGSTVSSSDDTSEDGADISETNAKKETTYTGNGWDFTTIWGIDEGNAYPELVIFGITVTTTISASGSGTGSGLILAELVLKAVIASGSGVGSGITSLAISISAVGSGIGSGIVTGNNVKVVVASGSGIASGQASTKLVLFTVMASGSGTGTGISLTRLILSYISASASGLGSGTNTVYIIKPIKAAGSGVGTGEAILEISLFTIIPSSSGTGTGETTANISAMASVSGAGIGTGNFNGTVASFRGMQVTLEISERTITLGVNEVPIIGNTVRLTAEFKNFEGEYVDIDTPQVKIYNGKRELLETHGAVKTATGRYRYDYTIPDDIQDPIYYEFGGTIMDKAVVGRNSLERRWT